MSQGGQERRGRKNEREELSAGLPFWFVREPTMQVLAETEQKQTRWIRRARIFALAFALSLVGKKNTYVTLMKGHGVPERIEAKHRLSQGYLSGLRDEAP
jgi:hypothetical protein